MQNISLFDEIMPEYLLADEMDTGNNTDAGREDGVVAIRGDENLANDAVIDDVQKHDADAELFWQSCLSELKHELKESELNQWLRSLKPVFAKDALVLFAINDVFIRTIKSVRLWHVWQVVVVRMCQMLFLGSCLLHQKLRGWIKP